MLVCNLVSILQLLTLFHLVVSRQNNDVMSRSNDYPSWPNPGTWNGTFSFPAKNLSGNLTFCYDGDKLKFAKYFTFESDNSLLGLIFDDTKEYFICFGPSDCATGTSAKTCKTTDMPQFPFPSNQFENYTYISQFTRVDSNNNNSNNNDNNNNMNGEIRMDLWVGNNVGYGKGYFGTNQYFDSSTGNIVGNIIIQEPGWVTEIRWFDTVWNGYDSSCFQIPDYCN